MKKNFDDCFTSNTLLSATQAWEILKANARAVVGKENIPVFAAHGRILAEDYFSPFDVPPFNNVAVDGYAYRKDDLQPKGETKLKIIDTAAAGHSTLHSVEAGSTIRVLTGAALPAGADAVLMQEQVDVQGEELIIPADTRARTNWRPAGEDIRQGQQVLTQGQSLRPQDIGSAASIGQAELCVYQPLRVAIFSTGDELYEPGTTRKEDGIYDINRHLLNALLQGLGCEIHDLGILPDKAEIIRQAVDKASAENHVVLTSGGASTGDEDHIQTILTALGEIYFWRLAIKPGRPLMAGRIHNALFFGFPGNPVALAICFMLFARPVLQVLRGAPWQRPQYYRLPINFELDKKAGRREWIRAYRIHINDQDYLEQYPNHGSGILSSLTAADGLIELAEDTTQLSRGNYVNYLPFSELGIIK